jgi:integrase
MKRRPRGSGSVFREGAVFSIRYGPHESKRYETGFRTRAEAEARLVVLRSEAMNRRLGVAADPRLTPTLGELAPEWLKRRLETHANGPEDRQRWNKYLGPAFGHLRPDELDDSLVRTFVEQHRRSKYVLRVPGQPLDGKQSPASLRVCVSLLSSLYEDLLERHLATRNPARHLPKSILRLLRPDHDPRTTAFVEQLEDVRRIFLALEEPLNVAYAIGALGGLRTGEVFALRWTSVDLEGRRMLVSESVKGRTKDREPRPVPILDPLLPILKAWKLSSGGRGLVIPPLRCDGEHVDKRTPAGRLRPVLVDLKLPPLEPKPWYQATRHTFASQWAMAGGSLRELQAILGHASITDTERYAHLVPGHFSDAARSTLAVDLSASCATVTPCASGSSDSGPKSRRSRTPAAGSGQAQ